MLLKSISPFISIDKITRRDSALYIHFISHLDQSFVVPDGWKSIIYTSKHIADILAVKSIPIPTHYFKILNENQEHQISTPNGTKFSVMMFESNSLRGNVVFYFKSSLSKAIYSGPLVAPRSILMNPIFHECLHSKIDELYVDNTRALSSSCETVDDTAKAIYKLSRDYPDYLLFLNAPPFGYEELLRMIIKNYGLKVFAGPLIKEIFRKKGMENIFTSCFKDARVVIGEGYASLKSLKSRFAKKQLTIYFVESDLELKNLYKDYGLFEMHYTPHPSLFELYTFICLVRPNSVHGIYEDLHPLPSCLTSLCRGHTTVANHTENHHQPTCTEEVHTADENNMQETHFFLPTLSPKSKNQQVTRTEQVDTAEDACNTNEMQGFSLTLSQKNKNRIDLPRKVIGSQPKRMADEFISRIAIIKPTRSRTIIEELNEEKVSDDDEDMFAKSLSSASISSSLESLSSSAVSDIDDAVSIDNDEVILHPEPKEQSGTRKQKRLHMETEATSINPNLTKKSRQFVERRYKSKTFSKQPLVRYLADESPV